MSEQRMQAITAKAERPDTDNMAAGDAELLRRFLDERDEAAMTAIIERHGPLVMGLCRGILRNEQDAADAFQTTFLVLLKNAASIGKPASLSSWLHGVACRVALRARSQAARRRERESAGAAMAPSEPANIDDPADAETLRLIHEELGSLPERLRLPLILCCVEGASREEAARQLGWSLGSLKGRLERAREQLHRRLTRRGVVLSMTALTGVLAGQCAVNVPATLAASTVNSLVLVAGGQSILGGVVSANTAALTTGVLVSMKVAKLKFAALVAAAVLLTAGTSVVVVQTARSMLTARQPQVSAYGNATQGVILAAPATNLTIVEFPTNDRVQPVQPGVDRAQESLQLLTLAMHQYADAHGTLPAPATRGADGRSLLSWRVALLPYLNEQPLYDRFRHDEAWDSPHNRALLDEMPDVFDSIGPTAKQSNETFFQVFTGPSTPFPDSGGLALTQIGQPAATLLIVDAANAVPWTKPSDLPFVADQRLPALGGICSGGLLASWVDGGVIQLGGIRNSPGGQFRSDLEVQVRGSITVGTEDPTLRPLTDGPEVR